MIYADHRRIGDHGIGRFARIVLAGLEYLPVPLETDPNSPMDPWRLSRALRNLNRRDLFFSPGYNPPLRCPAPFAFTLHDLNHLDRPENSSALKRMYYTTIVKRACHSAARVFTVSEFSRMRIVEWSGVEPEKVVNVQCGVGPEYHPNVAPYKLPFPYVLCVSNRKGHKNELRQIDAFALSGQARSVRLVFTGNPTAELLRCIDRHGMGQFVHFVGLVPEAQLPSLYRSAIALTFASLYEGFGLPVLEAMACGTPVITSNTTSLPEVAGDAAILVNPNSVSEIAIAIQRIVTDTALQQQLQQKGLVQASLFSWKATTNRIREVLVSQMS